MADVDAALTGGSYEVIRARLVAQGKELAKRADALNARRSRRFGGTELAVIANERVRSENNCVPADILQIGGHLLLGYNVFFGLKKEVKARGRVLALQASSRWRRRGQAINPCRAARCRGCSTSERAGPDFTNLYKYYKDTRLIR
jgi:hypothetical protein